MDSSDSSDIYGSPLRENASDNLQKSDWRERITRSRPVHRTLEHAEGLLSRFSPAERLLLYVFTGLLALSTFALLVGLNRLVSTEVPARGGSLTEGIVGTPRFANPVLAVSEADMSVSNLVYSGLMRMDSAGRFSPDLASSYQISEDGTQYSFTLRDDATFHDGTPVTPEDILFTISLAKNPDIKSPRRADWEGVTVSSPDVKTIVFTLPDAYAPFLENTTLGILPKHLWQNVNAEEFPFHPLNMRPVGSGPYRVTDVSTDSTGAATRIRLSAFKEFALGTPHIAKFTFLFYPNEKDMLDGFNAGDIDSFAAATPAQDFFLPDETEMTRAPLTRVFGVFFNQNHAPLLADTSVRAALDVAVDKQALVNAVLGGYGVVLNGPMLPTTQTAPEQLTQEERKESARSLLGKAGWTWNEEEAAWKKKEQKLTFTLATADTPELAASAQEVARIWRELGVGVEVHVYPLSELNTAIIRPRSYDALLFGEVVGRSLDLFAFWHSSQRNDPGLNLALYTNTKTDRLLTEARATTEEKERRKLYEEFAEIVKLEHPAVFLFAPQFVYVAPSDLRGVTLAPLSNPAERFLSVHEWYLSTERVWNVFVRD